MRCSLTRHLADEAHMLTFGRALGTLLIPGLTIFLRGELGAGKTTLARGILRGLGYEGRVKSPTYTLVELYNLSRLYLYHFDFYRLDNPHAWIDAGLRECFSPAAVCLVEWPERAGSTLPPADLDISITLASPGRQLEIVARSTAGQSCLAGLAGRTE
jgi:tRNA threonylcarbamoyladenosine biosynthesis protein TsaE